MLAGQGAGLKEDAPVGEHIPTDVEVGGAGRFETSPGSVARAQRASRRSHDGPDVVLSEESVEGLSIWERTVVLSELQDGGHDAIRHDT